MELIGRQFGHIRVTEVVGEGGMGAVYAGHDTKLDRKVALKVLHADQRLDEEARERLLREARALSKVDHPNICRIHDYIETGDVDLLVLEYIDGRTLQKAIEEGLPHGEKLRIALAVAEVLVQAHRAGIVHRDLKPENVMLTRSGEVKVLDFGLARWFHARRQSSVQVAPLLRASGEIKADDTLAMPAARHSDVSPSGRREFLATAAGITLGTPLFMSPEQARGENLTPASDMFAFGLLLQVLFTGKDPHPDVMTAREIILRVARGETNAVEGAPSAITTLINNLKQFAPTDRPTAVEAVDRLKFLIATPQRIARRSIAAAVIAVMLFGGWRYVVDLDRERSIAVAARADAERQRAKAEDLIDFMLGDLKKKLEPVGRLDVLDDAAQRALRYVDELNPGTSSAGELARNSKPLNQLVEVRVSQGNLTNALDVARRSVRLTELAVAKQPSDPEVQLAYATSQFWLGDVLRRKGELPAALQRMKEYSRVTAELAKRYPDNETYQLESAYGHSNIASMMEAQNDLPAALRELRLTLAVKQARLAAKPLDSERRADLAVSFNKIGFVQLRLGDLRGALSHFEKEASTYERLRQSDPLNQTWNTKLGRSLGYAAAATEMLGDREGAMKLVDREIEILSALHRLDPANALVQRSVAMANLHRAWFAMQTKNFAEARPLLDRAETLIRDLVARDPLARTWHAELATVLIGRARLLTVTRSPEAARRLLDAARKELSLAAANPRLTGDLELQSGDVAHELGDLASARHDWTIAAESYAKDPLQNSDPRLQASYVRAMFRLRRQAEVANVIAHLDEIGYRHFDFVSDRAAFANPNAVH